MQCFSKPRWDSDLVRQFFSLGSVPALLVGLLFGAACAASGQQSGAVAGEPKAEKAQVTKSGAQLWAENCMRCHNSRAPSSYNDADWDVVVHHMRVRANLTSVETTRILEFLQAAN